MTCSPDFKVAPLFDADYYQKRYEIRDSCNRRGLHMPFEWLIYLEWLSEIFNNTKHLERSLCDSWASCLHVPCAAVACSAINLTQALSLRGAYNTRGNLYYTDMKSTYTHACSDLSYRPTVVILGRQREHAAVVCSGALLFSSRVLLPSLVTLCSHKSGRC